MKVVRLVCPGCRNRFIRPPGTNRKWCETCRPPRFPAPAAPVDQPADDPDPEPEVGPPVERPPGPIEVATLAELVSFGRQTSVKGQIALRLARVLDDPELAEARLSAMASQLEKTIDAATAGATPPADRGDELAAARRLKRESAASA